MALTCSSKVASKQTKHKTRMSKRKYNYTNQYLIFISCRCSMDEPFLSITRPEEGTSSKPSIKREFLPGCLDIGPPRRRSIAHLITNDTIITTPKTPSRVNLIANLNKKRKLTRCSHSAPPVFTEVREAIANMDQPFLSITRLEEGTSTKPSIQREFPPGCLDLGPPRRQSTAHLITNDTIIPIIPTPKTPSYVNVIANLNKKRKLTRRSRSAPSVFTEVREVIPDSLDPRLAVKSTPLIVQQAFIGLVIYIIIGTIFYLINGNFKGKTTVKPVDALYFIVVTLCTIGYGDILPDTTLTKLFTCGFILVGFGFIDILLNGLVTYICDRQEAVLLSTMDENRFNTMVRTYMIDKEKGRMRIRIKVGLAMGVVIICIAIGTVTVHLLEGLNWVDSFYLSVTSVTTVGYGDYTFTTLKGRCFAIVWLLVSTLAVARAFLYLTELRIDKRNRIIAKWVLQKKMTLGDLVAADLDNDGSISKSEFVIYKLKEMGKIAPKDILQICNQFDLIDVTKCGKITVADLMEMDTN